jgi:outer membrane protein, multidrug efflux system
MKTALFRTIVVLPGIFSLIACSQLPALAGADYQKPIAALPAAWSTPTTQPVMPVRDLVNWWRQLDDTQLNQLIDEAQVGSVDLKLAQSRLRQARASRQQAVSGLFPSLTASTGASRNKNATAISTAPVRTLYDAGFDASWEIDLFGGTRRGIEAASAELEASEASLNNVRVSLLAEVAQNYVELRAYQHRLAIARDNLTSQSETVQITEWRNQAGLASSSDVEQARTSREQTRASIPDLEIGQAAAENRLAVLLGKNPGALHGELAEMRDFPPVPASVGAGIPADVLRQRPDLIVAERTLAAEAARLGQKQAQRFPSLNLGGSFGWQAYSFGALGGADTVMRAISGTLAATLFDGGKLRSAVNIQSAVQEQALLSYQSGVLGALEEVENALTAYAASRERLEARQAAAEAARNAASLARNLYQSGLADFQKVLETERTRLSAEDSLATAQASRLTSLITLYKALGGGWQQAAPSTENEKS